MSSMSQTLLLIEDDSNDVQLFQRTVKKTRLYASIHVVGDGETAQRYLEGQAPFSDRRLYPFPTLVFLDLNLPGMSGLEFLTWLRQQPRSRRVQVIVLAGSERTMDIYRAYELGANAYLVKPLSPSALLHVVNSLRLKWRVLTREQETELHQFPAAPSPGVGGSEPTLFPRNR